MRLIRNLSEDEEARGRVRDAGITQNAEFLIEVKPEADELAWLNAGAPMYLGQTQGGVFCVVLDPKAERGRFLKSTEKGGEEEWRPTNAS